MGKKYKGSAMSELLNLSSSFLLLRTANKSCGTDFQVADLLIACFFNCRACPDAASLGVGSINRFELT